MTDVLITASAAEPLVIETDRATLVIRMTGTGDVLMSATARGYGPPPVTAKFPKDQILQARQFLLSSEPGRWEHRTLHRTVAMLTARDLSVRLVIGKLGPVTRNQSAWIIPLTPSNVADLRNWAGTIPVPPKSQTVPEFVGPVCGSTHCMWPDEEAIDVWCELPEGHEDDPDDEGHSGMGFDWTDD